MHVRTVGQERLLVCRRLWW